MIDNFVILITCGAVVLVAFRAALLDRRGQRAQKAESIWAFPARGWRRTR